MAVLTVHPGRAGAHPSGTATPDTLERALLQALNFPALTFLRVMFIHLPAGFVAGFIAFAVMSPRLGILLSAAR